MTGERWTFGASPLPAATQAAGLLRRVTSLLQAVEHDDPAVDGLIADLARAEAALAGLVPADPAPRVGPAAGGDGRLYLDHARDVGAYNPAFPEYDIAVDGDRATGTVTFPLAYEGPPGLVHGGFLALFFDCVVQHHNCDVGVAGKTTSLALRYRRPVPLLVPLRFELDRATADGRIRSTGRLRRAAEGAGGVGGRVLCEAEVDAVAGDLAALPAFDTRRSRP